jgi:hypothetical protein
MTAGEELRARWHAALAERSKEIGDELVWDLLEEQHLDAAARAADRGEVLQAQWDTELASEGRPTVLVKLSAEMRAVSKAMLDHLGRVSLDDEPAKSPQHQAAVNARWNRRRAEHEAARQGRGY